MGQEPLRPNDRAAETVFGYLSLRDPPADRADLIMGFGHFDMRIPARCGELWRAHRVPVLLTGGVGAGTADLGRPEADAFRDELRRLFPEIPGSDVLVENRSANTTENILFSLELLRERFGPGFPAGRTWSVVLVASPYRQRRVHLACLRHLPGAVFHNAPPDSDFSAESALFASKGQDLRVLLAGEVDRLVNYPKKGYIIAQEIPSAILDCSARLGAPKS
jgi:uncharacterized SAM-binding protein YcdF (DUF218 family)